MKSLYQKFFKALPIRYIDPDEQLDLLTPDELYLVRTTETSAVWASVLVELASYLLTYIPVYAYPQFFHSETLRIGGPFFGSIEPLPWIQNAWSTAINLLEVYVLLLVNLAAVQGIAVATGYIRRDRPETNVRGLVRIAMDRRSRKERAYGIDPFQGLNHWLLYGYLLINRLKGFFGNVLIRTSLLTFFGTEIRRVWLDFSGMPLYMAINVYSTKVILRNARVSIMGQAAVESAVRQLPDLALDGPERELLYDALQYVAMNKRNYHINHFYLTRGVLSRYGIPVEQDHWLSPDFIEKLKTAPPTVAAVCRLVVVLGFILDGQVSREECRNLRHLNSLGVLPMGPEAVKGFCRDFLEGRGLGPAVRAALAG